MSAEKNKQNYDSERIQTTLWQDIWSLVKKIVMIVLMVVLLFTFMFGIFQYCDSSMMPSIKEGDLVLFYRLDKNYLVNDCLVYEYQGKKFAGRVIAMEGDSVDITEDGLKVNGALQQENNIYSDTLPYTHGVIFPLTVEKGQVFILGDNRENAADSRLFGAISIKDTMGKVTVIVRRRGI